MKDSRLVNVESTYKFWSASFREKFSRIICIFNLQNKDLVEFSLNHDEAHNTVNTLKRRNNINPPPEIEEEKIKKQ